MPHPPRRALVPKRRASPSSLLPPPPGLTVVPPNSHGVHPLPPSPACRPQAERFGAEFKQCDIATVDIDCRPFRVICDSGDTMTSSAIIVATGASPKWLGVKGEAELLSNGVHTCATCDGFFYRDRHAAVIGGGDTAMEQVGVGSSVPLLVVPSERRLVGS